MSDDKLFGFLNIYKPVGMTSHDVVGRLRKVTNIKQIGHTGTLDPFAEGVLPVAIGKATRLIEFLNDDKAYIGKFCFGKSTSTFDTEGEVVKEFSQKIDKNDLLDALTNFEGEIEQIPPMYSAIKINGKKLYEYAREGVEVEVKSRKVKIEKIKLMEFDNELQQADIYIECSKGTYIRSIANDLGNMLDNGCYLSRLQRVKAGAFGIDRAIMLDSLQTKDDVRQNILNPIEFLDFPKQELNDGEVIRVHNGLTIYNKHNIDGTVILTFDNNIVGVAQTRGEYLKAGKVFKE